MRGSAMGPPTDPIPDAWAEVVPGIIYRSAQPREGQWEFVKGKGVSHVLKLNFPQEGIDDQAVELGMLVHNLAIQPAGLGSIVDQVRQTFVVPDRNLLLTGISLMEWALKAGMGAILVHCQKGHDRTGLEIALFRIRVQGWSVAEAFEEAVRMGFHPELSGLDRALLADAAAV